MTSYHSGASPKKGKQRLRDRRDPIVHGKEIWTGKPMSLKRGFVKNVPGSGGKEGRTKSVRLAQGSRPNVSQGAGVGGKKIFMSSGSNSRVKRSYTRQKEEGGLRKRWDSPKRKEKKERGSTLRHRRRFSDEREKNWERIVAKVKKSDPAFGNIVISTNSENPLCKIRSGGRCNRTKVKLSWRKEDRSMWEGDARKLGGFCGEGKKRNL